MSLAIIVIIVFITAGRREMKGLINTFKFEMKCERVSEICSVCVFWLLVVLAYDLVLGCI